MFVFICLEGHLYIKNNFYGDEISPDSGDKNRGIFSSPVVCLCHGFMSVMDLAP